MGRYRHELSRAFCNFLFYPLDVAPLDIFHPSTAPAYEVVVVRARREFEETPTLVELDVLNKSRLNKALESAIDGDLVNARPSQGSRNIRHAHRVRG
jgi:hypothetical protein